MVEGRCRRPLDINYENLLSSGDRDEEDPLRDLVIIRDKKFESNTDCTAGIQQQGQCSSSSKGERQIQQQHEIGHMSDDKLDETIRQKTRIIDTIGHKLSDKGMKLRIAVNLLEDERERRRLRQSETESHQSEKLLLSEDQRYVDSELQISGFSGKYSHPTSPLPFHPKIPIGTSHRSKQDFTLFGVQRESSFASAFSRKLDENKNHRDPKAFDKEVRYLGGFHAREAISPGLCSPVARMRTSDENGIDPYSFYRERDVTVHISARRNSMKGAHSFDLRPRKASKVILVDEEESAQKEIMPQIEKLSDCGKDTQIYYPSRDDPDSVYICYSDIACLAPEAYLSSTVMNFYIRYLQERASAAGRVHCEYQFFNTYFYKKLKEALTHKVDKCLAFSKFRRWWKGVNLFQKAYVLIPIHDELHWSLIIICIPSEEEELGPVILHLDSLRLHCSKSIFLSIRSFLKEEWKFLNGECSPVRNGIWKNLPGHIQEKRIPVPQQTNEYDCGLFVLFFMERFMEEAPERLKKDDLAKFGREWFRPEEASSLRMKIRKLLVKEFRRSECLPSSSHPRPNERRTSGADL